MHASRSRLSLLSLLAALGLMLAPAGARAGSARPAAAKPAAKSASRSAAAKKGAETKAMNKKADANWATRVSKNPALAKDKAAEAKFKSASVRAQRQAASRKAGTTTAAAKKKPVKLAKKKPGKQQGAKRVATAEEPGAGVEPALAVDEALEQDGDELDAIEGAEGDDAPEASNAGGLWGKFQRYRAARRTFRALADANPELGQEVTLRSRLRGSFRNAFMTGGGTFMAIASIMSGGTLLAVAGAGVAAVGGTRELLNRDASRKELVEELAADKQLEPEEIATFQAAGWL